MPATSEMMSTLPPNAEASLRQLPEELRQNAAEFLGRIHVVDAALAEAQDLNPELNPLAQETVDAHLESIADQFVAAHGDANSEKTADMRAEVIWAGALRRQLDRAQQAKNEGNIEETQHYLVDYLITAEMAPQTQSGGYFGHSPEEEKKARLETALAQGLGPDLLTAAHNSYGLVIVKEPTDAFEARRRGPVITSVAHSIERVKPELEIITAQEVQAQPGAEIHRFKPYEIEEKIHDLGVSEAVNTAEAIAKTREVQALDKHARIHSLTKNVLNEIVRGAYFGGRHDEILKKLLTINPRLETTTLYDHELESLRQIRDVNGAYRQNDQRTYGLDRAIIELWSSGHEVLARKLLTAGREVGESSPEFNREGALEYAAYSIEDETERGRVLQEIEGEVELRRQAIHAQLEHILVGDGKPLVDELDRPIIDRVYAQLLHTSDPERASALFSQVAQPKPSEAASLVLKSARYEDEKKLLDILLERPQPLTDYEQLQQAINLQELGNGRGRRYDSVLFDDTEAGRALRSRLEGALPLLNNNPGLNDVYMRLFKTIFETRLFDDVPPDFVSNMERVLNQPVIVALTQNFATKSRAYNLLKEALDRDNPAEYLEEKADYLASLQSALESPYFAEISKMGSLANLIQTTCLDAEDPQAVLDKFMHVDGNQFMHVLRELSEVAGPYLLTNKITQLAHADDVDEFLADQEKFVADVSKVLEHPLLQMIGPNGPLAMISARIFQGLLASPNMLAFAEHTYTAFSKPQPLWKSLVYYTEAMVATGVDQLAGRQTHRVITVPLAKVPLGVDTRILKVDEILDFVPKQLSELTVAQKRAITADGLAYMSDAEVADLTELGYDQFTAACKRAIYAYQLEQTVELSRDQTAKATADLVNRQHAQSGNPAVRPGDYIHGTSIDYLGGILISGNVAGESRKTQSKEDHYPFNVDFSVIEHGESITDMLGQTITYGAGFGAKSELGDAGQVVLVYKRNFRSWMANQETFPSSNHALIFGGVPGTEINGMILTQPETTLETAKRAIIENGFYIPLYDKEGRLLFSPEQYDAAREDLNMVVEIPPENIIDGGLKAEDQKGITKGGLYLFPTNNGPQKYYVKFGTPEQVWTEYGAEQLYRVAGVSVPDTKVVQVDGQIGHASKWIESEAELPPLATKTLNDGAAMDMLLANWDVVYNSANHVEIAGTVIRPDSGSALDIWATGEVKREGTFTDEVRELNVGNNREALWLGMRQEYPNLTDEELRTQVIAIRDRITDEVIDQAVDAMRRTKQDRDTLKAILKARRDYMIRTVLG